MQKSYANFKFRKKNETEIKKPSLLLIKIITKRKQILNILLYC